MPIDPAHGPAVGIAQRIRVARPESGRRHEGAELRHRDWIACDVEVGRWSQCVVELVSGNRVPDDLGDPLRVRVACADPKRGIGRDMNESEPVIGW